MDVSGVQHLDVAHNIFKRRIDETGLPVEAAGEKEEKLGAKVVPAARQKDGSVHDPNATNETYCGSCYGSEAGDKGPFTFIFIHSAPTHQNCQKKKKKPPRITS